ncbi:MAG: hypothetical protein FWG66_12670 [Spirochaetes bacterium]|nr:hypothetical protein [Spirochaetota bacterium]
MFLLKSLPSVSPRLRFASGVFALLLAPFLFAGCSTGDDELVIEFNQGLIGVWENVTQGGTEIFTVTSNRAYYGFDDDTFMRGFIVHAVSFSANSGVIIVRHDPGSTAWALPGEVAADISGMFLGVYFRNLVPGVSVEMAQAATTAGTAEQPTLSAAINRFTLGNMATYAAGFSPLTRRP